MTDELLPPRIAAPMLGICTKTLWMWQREGKIRAVKTPTGRYLYLESEVKRVQKEMYGYEPVSLRGRI
jgi:predicted site-specific integrase-resolvase